MKALIVALVLGFSTLASAQAWPDLGTPPMRQGGGQNDAAVIVSIEKYATAPPVEGANQNGRDWYVYFARGLGIPTSRIRWLKDNNGAKEMIGIAVDDMAKKVQKDGKLWFVFIGHGVPAKDRKEGMLVGYDAQQNPTMLYARSVSQREILDRARAAGAKRTLAVIDACFSGQAGDGKPLAPGLQPLIAVQQQTVPEGALVLSAGKADEFAGQLPKLNRPAFSYLVLGGLRGWADTKRDGKVDAKELRDYTTEVLASLVKGRSQTPQLFGSAPNHALVTLTRPEPGPDLVAMITGRTSAPPVEAVEPLPQPSPRRAPKNAKAQLSIETGTHISMINRVGVNIAEDLILTCSDDKTARLWSKDGLNLLRTLRTPSGTGNEGKLFACDLSPDGEVAALAGWTGWDKEGAASVYLFDVRTGMMIRRIKGLPDVVLHIEFSRDNKHMAVTLSGGAGLRVYDRKSWRQIGTDSDYDGGESYGACWHKGKLATASMDGWVRTYTVNGSVNPTGQVETVGRAFSCAWNKSGSEMAVGFSNSTKIEVYNAAKMTLAFAPDITGVDNGDLSAVAYSHDGKTLYGAGLWDVGGKHQVRAWGAGGRGSYRDAGATFNSIMALRPLKGGGIVLGSHDPRLVVMDKRGKVEAETAVPAADFRLTTFELSPDGRTVRFQLMDTGPVIEWSVDQQHYKLNPTGGRFSSAVQSHPNVDVQSWNNSTSPTLDGEALAIEAGETSRQIAFTGDRFAHAAEWYTRLFTATGEVLWKKPNPGVAWRINVPEQGRVVVVEYSDGTIRWLRLSDGEELLALFPHSDQHRWIAWTPSGYYAASDGGHGLVGWHLERGLDQAAWFMEVGAYAERNRPDVVLKVLTTLDEAAALQ